MTAETSNARGEWVLVPRVPTEAMISHGEEWEYSTISNGPAMARQLYAAMLAAAPPPPADARGDVRGLVALAEQMERDAAGCRRDGYTDAAVVKEDCAQRIRQTLGISAIAEALAAEGVQAGEVSSYDLAVLDDAAETLDRIGEGSAGLREARARIASAIAQQPAAPSGEAGAFDANFLQSVASLCRAAYDLCQPKPQRTPEDPREHYGELCLLELTSIADEIERRLAAAEGVQPEESRSVAHQLLHWGGIPVRVTGTVTTSPGNWPLIDATQHQEPKS